MLQELDKTGVKWCLSSNFSFPAKFQLIQSGIFGPIRAHRGGSTTLWTVDNLGRLWIVWLNYGWWCGCSVDLWCIHHLSTSRPMKPKAHFRCPSVCRFPVACCDVNVDILDRCWLCSHARTSHWFYPVLMNMLCFECWHSRVLTLVLLPSHRHCMSWMWRLWGSWRLCGGGLWIYYFSTAQIVDDVMVLWIQHITTAIFWMVWRKSDGCSEYEPRHDKTNTMSVRPAKTQISLCIRPVWSESSLCA